MTLGLEVGIVVAGEGVGVFPIDLGALSRLAGLRRSSEMVSHQPLTSMVKYLSVRVSTL